jgi:hypothetical protein
MNIQAEKIELVKMLLDTENPEIIESIKNIFKNENSSDFWDELSHNQHLEIENATREIENGEVVDFDTFMKKHR